MTTEKAPKECTTPLEALEQIQMFAQDVEDGKTDYTKGEVVEIILDYTKPHVGDLPTIDDETLMKEARRRGLVS